MYAMMASNGQKRNKAPTPELPDELVSEIMTRLPVKSLLRFKCVSKAWRTTISGPSFVQSHLKISACRWEQNPSFLIAPHTLERDIQGTIFPGNIGFYQWQQGVSEARLVHDRDLFRLARFFSHCDGLVLVPTGTKVYLFNPATRDVLTLPESSHNKVPSFIHHPVGFGRDPRTGMYKVVRSLFGSTDCKTGIVSMGMEVCTLGGPAPPQWREIAGDQPYAPGTLMLRFNRKLCLYDLQSRELANACELIKMRYRRHGSSELEPACKHVYFCNVIPYMESLVPVGAHMA